MTDAFAAGAPGASEPASAPSILACSVRGCHLGLVRQSRVFVCPRRHTFDIARSGYVNLLQPQDRRSPNAGDSKDALAARAALLAAGVGRHMLGAFVDRAAQLLPAGPVPVAELGAGFGDALAALGTLRSIVGVGVDLSIPAMDHAARHHPSHTWIVANVDRRLPLTDASIQLVLSYHGRRRPAECARVLTPTGRLLVAVPAADDLIELRAVLGGRAIPDDRTDRLIVEHTPWFDMRERFRVEERHRLTREAVGFLLRGTYRGQRHSAVARLESLESLDVTLASDVFQFVSKDQEAR